MKASKHPRNDEGGRALPSGCRLRVRALAVNLSTVSVDKRVSTRLESRATGRSGAGGGILFNYGASEAAGIAP